METNEDDVLGVIDEIQEELAEIAKMDDVCEALVRHADEQRAIRDAQDQLRADLDEGSVVSLARAKVTLNQMIDSMIEDAVRKGH